LEQAALMVHEQQHGVVRVDHGFDGLAHVFLLQFWFGLARRVTFPVYPFPALAGNTL
jgi:hypothetical protein